ncbi:unnamed protein product [Candidula unifasciata]|uniref:Uncharacterized protein n=1 Tax=Candidula unifasciata TaxID=100452 RepID=A0A8S3ZJ05_9EUPU|nr:unnamed protein product [Candidula unifasciata]
MSGEGGLWNAPKVVYSKQTHDLLKDMMRESKLTNLQQRHIERTLKEGGNLPTNVLATSSKSESLKRKSHAPLPKVLNPRICSGGIRTKDTMQAMGAFEKPEYTPSVTCTRSCREKEKLANIMAYGEDKPQIQVKRKQVVKIETPPPLPDRFDELQNEIRERQEFLKDMEALGQGDKYRTIIATEISQKIREMEVIDKKRSIELQKMIELEDKQKLKIHNT